MSEYNKDTSYNYNKILKISVYKFIAFYLIIINLVSLSYNSLNYKINYNLLDF